MRTLRVIWLAAVLAGCTLHPIMPPVDPPRPAARIQWTTAECQLDDGTVVTWFGRPWCLTWLWGL